MSRNVSASSAKRPSALSTKSFTRYEPPAAASPVSPTRSRASTIQSVPPAKSPRRTDVSQEDIFDKPIEEGTEPSSPAIDRSHSLPDRFDELPIELASLSDRFVDSLGAKVYHEPPTADQLSDLFQEFYARASGAVSIHIATLRSRLNRENSPTPSKASSRTRGLSNKPSTDALSGSQQMLTANEVAERRKQRKLLEYKRILLEEAVEKRVCENIYDKIWRHKSTLDEVRDEKLRSKTAALALVGIGLKDLGIDWSGSTDKSPEDVQAALAPARESLAKMNHEHYPLGKLQHLTTAHKAVVDTLSSIHSSSSSADEILPTLIYTLITSPIEGISAISNLQFIQRFRAAPKIDGEAAYCLTNLEAAVTFLEDVDLASLRDDEKPEGPDRVPSQSDVGDAGEKIEPFPAFALTAPTPSTPTTASSISNAVGPGEISPAASTLGALPAKSSNKPATRHQRTLSDILQPINTANEAVLNTAGEGFKNITNTLDNSFTFLIGKLKERGTKGPNVEVVVPKTLDEARQLVSRPLTPDEDDHALSESSSINDGQSSPMPSNLSKTEEKLLGLLGGRRPTVRERSVDSVQSNASIGGRRTGLLSTVQTNSPPNGQVSSNSATTGNKATQPSSQTATSNNPLEMAKNFGNTLNPINHLGSAFGAFGRFSGRASASPPSALTSTSVTVDEKASRKNPHIEVSKPGEVALRTPSKDQLPAIRAAPPVPRFLTLGDAAELKLGEVQDLLDDYQRLARVLGKLVQRAQNEEDNDNELTRVPTSSSQKDDGEG